MSNRKKERMDAIEQRVASLEGTIGKPTPGLFGYDLPNRVSSTDHRVDAIDRRLAWLEGASARTPSEYLQSRGWENCGYDERGHLWCKDHGTVLVEHEAWEMQRVLDADPPEFSCQPTYEPDDDRVIREAREQRMDDRYVENRPSLADGVKPHWTMSGVADDVRERVRERSELADALAGIRDLYAVECSDADLLAKAAHEIRERRRNA